MSNFEDNTSTGTKMDDSDGVYVNDDRPIKKTERSDIFSQECNQATTRRSSSIDIYNVITIKDALGFDDTTAEEETTKMGSSLCLLIVVLSYVGESTDLVRTRCVCRAFRLCSDKIAIDLTQKLIGDSIEPIVGQSAVALLHGAETANEITRIYLKGWDGVKGRAEGFNVGLPTHQQELCFDGYADAVAVVPAGDMAPTSSIPISLKFKKGMVQSREFTSEYCVYLPRRFFHLNVSPSGSFVVYYQNNNENRKDKSVEDILRRVKRSLSDANWNIFHSVTTCRIYQHRSNNTNHDLYHEFLEKCMNIFSDYKLGEPIPSLRAFHKLVGAKLESFRMKEELDAKPLLTSRHGWLYKKLHRK